MPIEPKSVEKILKEFVEMDDDKLISDSVPWLRSALASVVMGAANVSRPECTMASDGAESVYEYHSALTAYAEQIAKQ